MKRIIFLLVFLSPVFCSAQTFNEYITNWRAYNNTNVTTKTTPHSITPVNVGGGIGDSLGKWLQVLHDTCLSLISAAGDLQAVTDVGNITTNEVNSGMLIGTYSSLSDVGFSSYSVGSYLQSFIGTSSGIGIFKLRDASTSNFSQIKSGILTSTRTVILPDEGDGAGLDATLVTHTTKDAITVLTASFQSDLLAGGVIIKDVSNNKIGKITVGGGLPALSLQDPLSSLYGIIQTAPLTVGSKTVLIPNEGDGSGLDATLVTHTTKDPLTLDNGTSSICSLEHTGIYNTNASDNSILASNGLVVSNATESMQLVAGGIAYTRGGTYIHQNVYQNQSANRTTKFPDQDGVISLRDTVITLTDADFVISIKNSGFYILPAPTATRNLTLPTTPPLGTILKIYRDNTTTGFDWTFSGGSIVRPSGTAFTVFADGTITIIEYIGGSVWIGLNI